MGNHYSDMKSSIHSSSSVPKHLKPSSSCSSMIPSSFSLSKKSNSKNKQKKEMQSKREVSTAPSTFIEEETVLEEANLFKWSRGRRFYTNKGGLEKTLLLNDQVELDRLGVLNFIFRWALKGYIVAPIQDELQKGIQVLNIAYGPGLWPGHQIIDLALEFKNSKFTAVDVINLLPSNFSNTLMTKDTKRMYNTMTTSPLFTHPDIPTTNKKQITQRVLDNLSFSQCNIVESRLPCRDNTFDFVKHQLGTTSFTIKDWIHIIKEIVRVTKPGGYIQLIEIDYHIFNSAPSTLQWETELSNKCREKRQLEPRMATYISDLLEFVGLIDVSSTLVSIPIGSWGLELGELWERNLEMFVDSSSPLMSQFMGISLEAYKKQWENSMKESQDNKPFSNLHAAYGRKPSYPLDLDRLDWSTFPPFASVI